MTSTISTYVWPGQTHFGFGAASLASSEIRSTGGGTVFIHTDPGIISAHLLDPVIRSLEEEELEYLIFEHTPSDPDIASVDAAAEAFRQSGADSILAVGGGSVMDAAKGVRLAAGGPAEASVGDYSGRIREEPRPAPRLIEMPPMIAVPTTAGTGSEVTPWGVLTDLERNFKFGIGGPELVPTTALIDPGMTLTLPPRLTAATGIDALSHCIEAYVSTNSNPALDPMILHGIELIGRSLRTAVHQPEDRQARQEMMLASMIGGIAISSKWLGACHSLAHQLSSFAKVHHGEAIALMLPCQMSFSLSGALEKYSKIGQALTASNRRRTAADDPPPEEMAEEAVEAVRQLISDIGIPSRLRDVGVASEMIPAMASCAFNLDGNWPTNPVPVEESDFIALYQQVY